MRNRTHAHTGRLVPFVAAVLLALTTGLAAQVGDECSTAIPAVLGGNAVEFYGLDAEKLAPLVARMAVAGIPLAGVYLFPAALTADVP